MQMPGPTDEHRWLHRLVGDWTVTSAIVPEGSPDWTEHVRSLGGLWVVAEGRGGMPDGSKATTVMTLGYDPRRGMFVGNWVGSMMTHMWVYEGRLDAARNELTLDCEGEDFEAPGRIARYQDVITFKGDDHRLLTARMQAADGTWKQLMQAEYRRRV